MNISDEYKHDVVSFFQMIIFIKKVYLYHIPTWVDFDFTRFVLWGKDLMLVLKQTFGPSP